MEIAIDVARMFKPVRHFFFYFIIIIFYFFFLQTRKKNLSMKVSHWSRFKFTVHMIIFFKTSTCSTLMNLAQEDYYFIITQDS